MSSAEKLSQQFNSKQSSTTKKLCRKQISLYWQESHKQIKNSQRDKFLSVLVQLVQLPQFRLADLKLGRPLYYGNWHLQWRTDCSRGKLWQVWKAVCGAAPLQGCSTAHWCRPSSPARQWRGGSTPDWAAAAAVRPGPVPPGPAVRPSWPAELNEARQRA